MSSKKHLTATALCFLLGIRRILLSGYAWCACVASAIIISEIIRMEHWINHWTLLFHSTWLDLVWIFGSKKDFQLTHPNMHTSLNGRNIMCPALSTSVLGAMHRVVTLYYMSMCDVMSNTLWRNILIDGSSSLLSAADFGPSEIRSSHWRWKYTI